MQQHNAEDVRPVVAHKIKVIWCMKCDENFSLIWVWTVGQVRAYLVRDFRRKQSSGYVWTEGDVEWSERNTILFPALSSLAGLIAGMFGVGGCGSFLSLVHNSSKSSKPKGSDICRVAR